MANYKQLKRYIIAFDGDLLPDYDVHTATHIVTVDKSEVCIVERFWIVPHTTFCIAMHSHSGNSDICIVKRYWVIPHPAF